MRTIKDLPGELWKDIPAYEKYYQVSNKGRILSVERTIRAKDGRTWTIKKRIMKLSTSPNGYHIIQLNKKGVMKAYGVARLVASQFIPNPLNKPQVNHRNGVKTDNRVRNLEWVTRSENRQHSIYVLGRGLQPVKWVTADGLPIIKFPSVKKASDLLKIPRSGIYGCLSKRLKTTRGRRFAKCS